MVSKTAFILSITIFYIFIIAVLGSMGRSNIAPEQFDSPGDPGLFSFITDIGLFFKGLGFSLSSFGVLGNTLLFLPLGITLFWVIVSSLAPGGS